MNCTDRTPSSLFFTASRRWHRLALAERLTLAAGPLVGAALVLALAQTCEESIRQGERLRAEQRVAAPAVPADDRGG